MDPDRYILVDFAGTLIKPEVIEEAQQYRSQILERTLPSKDEHAHPEELYKANREYVEKLTGLPSDVNIQQRQNDGSVAEITGKDMQNQLATSLFAIGMYKVASKYKLDMIPEGFLDQLQKISETYKLVIISGVREDIISGMFGIAGVSENLFEIYGQPAILGVSNEELNNYAYGHPIYAIGDKMGDLEFGKHEGAKTIFVPWGHPQGGEKEYADYVLDDVSDLTKIILGK